MPNIRIVFVYSCFPVQNIISSWGLLAVILKKYKLRVFLLPVITIVDVSQGFPHFSVQDFYSPCTSLHDLRDFPSPQCRTFERGHVGGVFEGHVGQVTKVAWRTAGDDANSIFLSASLDDTIRVWHVDKPNPVCVLRLLEVGTVAY